MHDDWQLPELSSPGRSGTEPGPAGTAATATCPDATCVDQRLLECCQRDFPLVPRPFAAIGRRLDVAEDLVIARAAALIRSGAIARIGAVFAPGRVGAGMLAALAVPDARLAEVAAIVSAAPEVNHNYEREHDWNLWFVVTADDQGRVACVLDEVERRAACGHMLRLPMEEGYHIDLGFPLDAARERAAAPVMPGRVRLRTAERALAAGLQQGLKPVRAPYADLAARTGTTERVVLATLARWLDDGTLRRLGLIVRHRALGYGANAMIVWDVPDEDVAERGRRLATVPYVTLCYRRARALPHWRYNLYCMIHGQCRTRVRSQIAELDARCDLVGYPYEVLFSRQCFKQTGARYVGDAVPGPIHG